MPKRQMIFEPQRDDKKENTYYECSRCANRRSPLCELCTTVRSPGGKESKPKYYIEFTGVTRMFARRNELSKRGEECRMKLSEYLVFNEPLPVSLVMEYNEHVGKCKMQN